MSATGFYDAPQDEQVRRLGLLAATALRRWGLQDAAVRPGASRHGHPQPLYPIGVCHPEAVEPLGDRLAYTSVCCRYYRLLTGHFQPVSGEPAANYVQETGELPDDFLGVLVIHLRG